MVRTFNRQPLSVNTPDKKDIKQYFFNHYNWKGIINNKNFLGVDQESFEECNNVYVSSDGLLHSRPSLKKQSIIVKINNVNTTLANIIDIWQFGDTTVYESETSDNRYLTFVQNDVGYQTQLIFASGSNDKRVKLVVADRKIFIFTNGAFKYFGYDNSNTLGIYDAEDFIYIPLKEIITNDKSKTADEEENIMTSSYRKTYLYDNVIDYNFDKFINKNVDIKYNSLSFENYNFKRNSQFTFFKNISELNTDNFAIDNNFTYPLFDVADFDGNKIYVKSTRVDRYGTGIYYDYIASYSIDGETWKELPMIDHCIVKPILSRNGTYLFAITSWSIYVISILSTNQDGTLKYPDWTELYSFNSSPSNISEIDADNITNGYFIDDLSFCVLYKKNNYLRLLSSVDGTVNDTVINENTLTSLNFAIDSIDMSKSNINMYYNPIDEKFYTVLNYNLNGHYTLTSSDIGYDEKFINVNGINCNKLIKLDTSITQYSIGYVLKNIDNTARCITFLVFEGLGATISVSDIIEYYKFENAPLQTDLNSNTLKISLPSSRDIYYISYDFIFYNSLVSSSYRKYTIDANKVNYFVTFDAFRNIYYTSNYLYSPATLYLTAETVSLINSPFKKVFTFSDTNIIIDSNNDICVFATNIELTETIAGDINYMVPEYEAETDNYFISTDKTLYISQNVYNDNGDFLWYFPKINIEEFDYKITNLHSISSSEVAIFTNNAIYYASYDNDIKAYRYYKSKVQVGLKDGYDVITTYDGKYVVFATNRGVVALSYQDFIASTEQSLSYISDNVYDNFYDYLTNDETDKIKIFKYAYWIIFYKPNKNLAFMLDTRNNSWWLLSSFKTPNKFIDINNHIKILMDGNLIKLDLEDTNYYDFFGEYDENEDRITHKVEWFIKSQKLYLSAINYYKHIVNMTFTSVHDLDNLQSNDYNVDELDFKLEITNYRKKVDSNISFNGDYPIITYEVNIARTFVQRLNFGKVNEFQYRMSYDDRTDKAIEVPLSLNSITVKYKIGDMVR